MGGPAGQPSTWGGDSVYATIVSLSSILLNLHSMYVCTCINSSFSVDNLSAAFHVNVYVSKRFAF
jgi:hypothetical protein